MKRRRKDEERRGARDIPRLRADVSARERALFEAPGRGSSAHVEWS